MVLAKQLPARRDAFTRLMWLGIDSVSPAWFTGAMGTGILAICATISPVAIPFASAAGAVLWTVDAFALAGLALMLVLRTIRTPRAVLTTLDDPTQAQTWGAPPMACFTVATGFLLIGERTLPTTWCIAAAQALWIVGAAGSIASALLVPYVMLTRHELTREQTFGSWLLPVVPPIVASVPAALLNTTWPAALRGDLLALAYALLGTGIILAAIIIVIFYIRLVYDNVPAGPLVPTMWIVVGPLGQSIAGIIALGNAATITWPSLGSGFAAAGLAYGVLVWGFAMYWLTMAVAVTLRTARAGQLDFTLGWWAFTFPVGVLAAGTDALYGRTHAPLFAAVSLVLVALLATMWTLVTLRTARHTLRAIADGMRRYTSIQTATVSET